MPSRKIISVLVVASALVAGIILASGPRERQESRKADRQIVVAGSSNVGLSSSDWKQELGSLSKTMIDASSTDRPATLTDQLSQSLMVNYLALKQQGMLDGDSAATLVDQATESVDVTAKNKYTSGNLIISTDNSKEAIRVYGTSLGTILKLNKPAKPQNEMAVFGQMAQNKDQTRVPELLEIAKVYKNVASSYSHVAVPSSYTSLHLQLINSLDKIGTGLEEMAKLFQDPIRALQGLSFYQTSYSQFLEASVSLKQKILDDGVVYKQGESGYYFYFGI